MILKPLKIFVVTHGMHEERGEKHAMIVDPESDTDDLEYKVISRFAGFWFKIEDLYERSFDRYVGVEFTALVEIARRLGYQLTFITDVVDEKRRALFIEQSRRNVRWYTDFRAGAPRFYHE